VLPKFSKVATFCTAIWFAFALPLTGHLGVAGLTAETHLFKASLTTPNRAIDWPLLKVSNLAIGRAVFRAA